jgi:hypothetical protein
VAVGGADEGICSVYQTSNRIRHFDSSQRSPVCFSDNDSSGNDVVVPGHAG